ncbi:MAG: methyltransferase domain-containing protein [Planctomycetaceae bacterium]
MISFLRDQVNFIRQVHQRFYTTGAVLPSSRFLAYNTTRPLAKFKGPKRVLELGPGTGAVTRHIVKLINPEDHFDLVEINEEFGQILRNRFEHDPDYKRVAGVSKVHICPLQEFKSDEPYDIIISGLPFNNFPSALVEELVEASLKLLAPDGTYSFFEYMFMRPMRSAVTNRNDRQRIKEIEAILSKRFDNFRFKRDWVFINVPPAWVHHLRFKGKDGT